jgi:hypothetical protein
MTTTPSTARTRGAATGVSEGSSIFPVSVTMPSFTCTRTHDAGRLDESGVGVDGEGRGSHQLCCGHGSRLREVGRETESGGGALRQEFEPRHIVFALARVKQDLRDDLDAFGPTEAIDTA